MKKAKNFSNRLMAMLLSAAMIFGPVLESVPVYAAEAGSGTEDIGTLPETAGMKTDASGGEALGGAVNGSDQETGTVDAGDSVVYRSFEQRLLTASASGFSNVGGWNESIYAEIAGVADADVTEVSYSDSSTSGTMPKSLTGDDLTYLVRSNGEGGVRIDIPGLKAGTYTLTVKVGGSTLTESGIEVYSYDRSGYAHFNYTEGVGAYKDDGTLKDNAIVLYVTDENKNTVTLTCNGKTVTGIGNILNSVGQDSGSGTTSNGGKSNTNQGIIKELSKAGKPLVVRFIGCVSETGLYKQGSYSAADAGQIEGLTDYKSTDNGGSAKDNGHMARIQSGKDITLEGIGYDAVIDGWGFHYIAQSSDPNYGKSFEVRNLKFINTPEDAIGMEGVQVSEDVNSDLSASVERCWIHHNEFYCPNITNPAESDKSEGDGSVDFKRGQYFTCSYNYFDSCHKTNLVGSSDKSLQYNLTYHHNHWYLCKARGPLARNANIHMYNNIVEMQTDYAQNTRANAYIFSEYNLFYACKSPQAVESGAIKSYHDSISSVIWNKGSAGTVVENKSEYVANNCQFQARKIKYDKFDTDAAQSYIPDNNYKLDTDFTELRKVIVSQTGVQAREPKLAEEVTVGEYTVVPKSATIHTLDVLPQNLTPGKITKSVYAFAVNGPFNLTVAYGSDPGVLVNEAGENLLTGNGELENLPAGTYMIQAENFQPGDAKKGTIAVFKDITISTLNIEAVDPNAHYHKWVLDSSKSVAATCTEEGKNFYTCSASLDGGACTETKEETVPAKGHQWKIDSAKSTAATCTEKGKNVYTCEVAGCDGTKEEEVTALGHSWSAWKVDQAATETAAGQKSRSCTRAGCTETQTESIPAGSTGTGGGGNSGEGTGSTYVHDFTAAGKTSTFYTITGSLSTGKGTVTYDGKTLTQCLKMESSTSITFTAPADGTLTLVFGGSTSAAGKSVKVNGTELSCDSNSILTKEVAKGPVSITKGDTINLFYMVYASNSSGGEGGGDTGDDEVTEYTITIDKADGSEATTKILTKGASLTAADLPTPSREGYIFKGWVDGNNKAITLPYQPTANVTIKAVWEKEIVVDPDALYNMYLTSLDIPTGTYTSDFRKNGFTIKAGAGADQSVSVDIGSEKTIGGKKYTGRLKTGGIGTKDYRSIQFTTKDAATLTMACAVATTGDECELGVARLNENGELVEITEGITVKDETSGTTTTPDKIILKGSKGDLVTVNLPAAGTYCIYSKGGLEGKSGGVNFYAINVTYANGVDPVFCTVTFNTMGGLSVESQKVQAGDACVEPAETLKTGYTFDGWYTDAECTQKYDFSAAVKSNLTLYAKWLAGEPAGEYLVLDMKDLPARDYKESFSRNGFTFKATSDKNLSVDVSAATVEDVNYTQRLKLNGTGSASDRNISFKIEANATLTLVAASGSSGTPRKLAITNGTNSYEIANIDGAAKYTQELTAGTWQIYAAKDGVNIYYLSVKGEGLKAQYTITIDKGDGTAATVKTVVEGTALTESDLPSTLTREGYTFQGWMDAEGNAITVPYTPVGNMTIKAKWQKIVAENQYAITIDRQDGTDAVEKVIEAGTQLTATDLPADLTKEGYTFQGWVDEEGNAITVPYTPTKSMTIRAKWQEVLAENQYAITIDRQDGTKAVEKVIEAGTQLTAADLPSDLTREGYTFQGWVDEEGNAITVPYAPTKSMTIKAKWEAKTVTPKIGLQVELAVPGETYVYTGSAIKPAIIVTNNGKELVEGTDYTVKYSNNIKACEWGKDEAVPKNAPKIMITGKGNFTGSAFTNFRIERKAIDETDTTGGTASVKAGAVTVVKGSKATPVLVYNGVKLGARDYTYKDAVQKNQKFGDTSNEDAETFEIELEGAGNYKGSRKVTVKAVKRDDLKTFTVTVGRVDLTYNGESQPIPADAITVKDKKTGGLLTNDKDHTYYEIVYSGDTISAGTVKFSVVGVGEYTGTVSKTYKIKPLKDSSKFFVDKDSIKESYDYNSAGVTLGEDLKVYYGSDAKGTRLREGTDYRVTYSNNKKVSKGNARAKYTITLLGNFQGSKLDGTFEIGEASLKAGGAKVEAADKVFKRAGIYKSVPIVTIDGVALKASDYKAEYYIVNADGTTTLMGGQSKVTAAGTVVEVKVTGKGNYKTGDADSVTGRYTVCDKGEKIDLATAKVAFYEKNADGTKGRKVTKLDYTGRGVEPAIVEVTVKVRGEAQPRVLEENKDYTLRYVNNKNKGKATVIVTAAKDSTQYAGSKTAKFSIAARNLKNQTGLLDHLFKMLGK